MVKDYSRTVMLRGEDVNRVRLDEEFHGMENLARAELQSEGLPGDRMTSRRYLDARYVGQSFELTIDYPSSTRRTDLGRAISNSFYQTHLQRFGYADRNEAVEIVNLRLKLEMAVEKPSIQAQDEGRQDASHARIGQEEVVFNSGALLTALFDRDALGPGNRISGPALLLQLDTTIVVPPGWAGTVDSFGNLVLEPQ